MNKIWLALAIIMMLFTTTSCSKDDNDGGDPEDQNIVGTWTASSGEYYLTLKITSSTYDFVISKPGKGGSTDKGAYKLSADGSVFLVNDYDDPLASGYLRNGKLSLTFVNPIAIMMLGTEAASNITFTLSEETEDDESEGFLIIQNLSDNKDIVQISLYDSDGDLLGTDTDLLESDYQFTYQITAMSYTMKITDSAGKTFTSKTFKVVKDKYTVLAYTGSAINILATGINESDLTRSAMRHTAPQSALGKLKSISHSEITNLY